MLIVVKQKSSRPKKGTKLSHVEIDKIVTEYNADVPIKKIAEDIGRSRGAVYKAIERRRKEQKELELE